MKMNGSNKEHHYTCIHQLARSERYFHIKLTRIQEVCADLHFGPSSSSFTLKLRNYRRVVETHLLLFDTSNDDVVDGGSVNTRGPHLHASGSVAALRDLVR
jgi:hypothetical protein